MTIDTSAVVAIIKDEPEKSQFVSLIEGATRRIMSAVSVLEATMVLESQKGNDASYDLDRFLRHTSIEIVPFDRDQLIEARIALRRYGKGRHPAGLNFGDCASYALAQWSGEPLLFKGSDFGLTDVPRVR